MIEEKPSGSFLYSIGLLILGGLLGGIVQEVLDYRRELRENTQQFSIVFNEGYYGFHRDNLHKFYVSKENLASVSGTLTRAEYRDWLVERVYADPDLSASVFAISEFYRTLDHCSREGRCKETSINEAFRSYAIIFYNTFYLVLRDADCTLGFPATEAATARIAGLPYPPPESCGSTKPYL